MNTINCTRDGKWTQCGLYEQLSTTHIYSSSVYEWTDSTETAFKQTTYRYTL